MLPNPIELELDKLEAGERQLIAAITLLFEEGDPVAVHTLAGAASMLLTDLVDHHLPGESWEDAIAEDNNMTKAQYLAIARNAQNFMKHANRDPLEKLSFDRRDSEHLLFFASLNLGSLSSENRLQSLEVGVFQFWYVGVRREVWDGADTTIRSLLAHAHACFPGIHELSFNEQLKRGRHVLDQVRKDQAA